MRELSRHAALRPVLSSDLDWLYALSVAGENADRWRYRGRTPSPSQFGNDLWTGVLCQFVVCRRDARPVGLVGLVNPDLSAAHAELFALSQPGEGGPVIEAVAMLLERAFHQFELNKVWVKASQTNLDQFARITDYFAQEGQLLEHEYVDGRYESLVILSMTRAVWSQLAEQIGATVGDAVRNQGTSPAAGVLSLNALTDEVARIWPLDSLGAVELAAFIEDRLGVDVDAGDLFRLLEEDTDIDRYAQAVASKWAAMP